MIVLIETAARFGKTTTANHLKILLNGAVVVDEPRCESKEQIEAFCRVCEDYSQFGDVIVTDAAGLLRQSKGGIMDIADLILVGRLHDNESINMLGLKANDVFNLMPGEWISAKESNRLDRETKRRIFESLVRLKQLTEEYTYADTFNHAPQWTFWEKVFKN